MADLKTALTDGDQPLVTRYGVFLFLIWNICMALAWMYDL